MVEFWEHRGGKLQMKSALSQVGDDLVYIFPRQRSVGVQFQFQYQRGSAESLEQPAGQAVEGILLCQVQVHLVLAAAAIDPAGNTAVMVTVHALLGSAVRARSPAAG